MSSLFGKIACIKASRDPESSPILDFERLAANQRKEILTQLIPDTNVIINMTKASDANEPAEDRTLQKYGLLEVVQFLRRCSDLHLTYYFSPFFSISEMPSAEAASSALALNLFSQKFGLNWTDAHPEIVPDLSIIGRPRKGYMGLELDERRWLAVPYSALLLMLFVARDFADCAPIVKFRRYLRLYRRIVNIVSLREIAVAAFVFAPIPGEDEEIYPTWDRIVRNFTGRKKLSMKFPTRPSQMDRVALNSAHDTTLLNVANYGDAKGLDGDMLDTWVITGDLKLHALTEVVHHTGFGTRDVGLGLVLKNFSSFGSYWREAHEEINTLGRAFRWDLKTNPDEQVKRALNVIALSELGYENTEPYSLRHSLSRREAP